MNINKNKLFSDKTLFYIYYLFKSTGFIITIFPIFLNDIIKLNLNEIVTIASYFTFIPLILEIPTGFLSDLWGNKKVVLTGLLLMICGILFLIIFPTKLSYCFYLGFMALAGNCFSGAEDVLLRNIATNDEEYFKIKSDLSSKFYIYSTSFLIVGGLIYKVNVFYTFYLQMISLIFSFTALIFLNVEKIEIINKLKLEKQISDIKISIIWIRLEKKFILLSLLIGWFSSIILLNNRTVQLLFLKLIGSNAPIYITIFFCLGNLCSSQGALFIKKYVNKIKNPIIFLSFLTILSYLFFCSNILILSILGYFILCFFKGAYRPYLNSKLMESIPIKSLRASFLSLSAFIGAIVAFFIQFTYGQIFKNIFEKNLLISILSLLFCILIIFFLSKSKNNSKIHLKNYNGFSSKENYIDIYNDSIVFIQKYFEYLCEDFKKGLNGIYSNIYPAPKIYKITNNEIYFEYTVGKISSNLNKNKQEIILSKILNNIKNNIKTISISNTNLYSETLSNADIFIENKDLYSKLCNTKYLSLIHGDLHPDNIIVTCDNYYVVDWDLFGIGYIWFDVLTLLTSPNLKLNKNQRIYNFIQIFPEFNESEVKLIFNIFIKQKINVFSKLKSSLFGYKMYTKFITLDKTFSRERGELSYE